MEPGEQFTLLLGQVSHCTSLTRPQQCQHTKLLQHGQVFKATLKAFWLNPALPGHPKIPSSFPSLRKGDRPGTQEDFAHLPFLQDHKLPRLESSTERSSQEPGFFPGLFANTWDF